MQMPIPNYKLACCYAQIANVNLCCENLEKAIGMDSKYKKMATEDSDFYGIKNEPCFKQLTEAV